MGFQRSFYDSTKGGKLQWIHLPPSFYWSLTFDEKLGWIEMDRKFCKMQNFSQYNFPSLSSFFLSILFLLETVGIADPNCASSHFDPKQLLTGRQEKEQWTWAFCPHFIVEKTNSSFHYPFFCLSGRKWNYFESAWGDFIDVWWEGGLAKNSSCLFYLFFFWPKAISLFLTKILSPSFQFCQSGSIPNNFRSAKVTDQKCRVRHCQSAEAARRKKGLLPSSQPLSSPHICLLSSHFLAEPAPLLVTRLIARPLPFGEFIYFIHPSPYSTTQSIRIK